VKPLGEGADRGDGVRGNPASFRLGVGGKCPYAGVPGSGDTTGENGAYGDPLVAPVGILDPKAGESGAGPNLCVYCEMPSPMLGWGPS
jgi:hypothetical protein